MCCKKVKTCFNTQPPEGGWQAYLYCAYLHTCFNTQPPEGGWLPAFVRLRISCGFQHTAARRRLGSPFIVL